MTADPDFRSGSDDSAGIGLLQLYPDGSSYGSFPGTEVSDGATGDELVLWILCDDEQPSGDDPVVASAQFTDGGGGSLGALTIAKTHRMVEDDSTFFVLRGTRPAGLERVDVVFDPSGPASWVTGNFPPGTWVDAGEDTYATDVGTFTPTGGPTFSLEMQFDTNLLQYAHALTNGADFACACVAYFEAGGPLVTSPGVHSAQVDGEAYSWRAFAEVDAPPAPAARTARECVLGCESPRVYLMDHCGGSVVGDVTEHATFLRWGRELDDDSETELSLHITGDASGRGCCDLLGGIRTWRNELMVVRGDETVWGPGPLVTIGVQRHIAHIVARDISAWLDVRLVHNDYSFVQADLATIAETVIYDALMLGPAADVPPATRDACILDYAEFNETGKYTDMEVKAGRRSAGEILRELSTQGLDYTVIRRSLIVGADFAWGPIGPLRDDHFQEDLKVTERGLAAATRWTVSSDNAQGSAGGADPFFGLIERGVEGQPAATSATDLSRMAADRLLKSNPSPLIVSVPSTGSLSPSAPVCMRTLVPGTLADLSIMELCRPANVRERLVSVRATYDDKGERIGVTLAPLGEEGGTAEGAEE